MVASLRSLRPPAAADDDGVRHEAFLYAGEDDYLAGTTAFISEGLESSERVLVAVSAERIDSLRESVDAGADDSVEYVDMARLGRNPARIIPAWRRFLDRGSADGRRVRGIGEPIWAGRSAAELVECQQHEALLNLAFATGPSWRLMCPYDLSTLDDGVIAEANRSHPVLFAESARRPSESYRPGSLPPFPDRDLPEPAAPVERRDFSRADLGGVRELVGRQAVRAGLDQVMADDITLAVHEIASNSLLHGGGRGTVRAWLEGVSLVCEVIDGGRIHDPLVGRVQPPLEQLGGRGVWLANQLCDLVQIRSGSHGTVVRMYLAPHVA